MILAIWAVPKAPVLYMYMRVLLIFLKEHLCWEKIEGFNTEATKFIAKNWATVTVYV